MNAIMITTDEKRIDISPKNGKYFLQEEIYDTLNCKFFEIMHLKDGSRMIYDDDGEFNRKECNKIATSMCDNAHIRLKERIFGDIILIFN